MSWLGIKSRRLRALRDSLRGRIGFYITRMAPREDIAALVRRMWAYDLGAPLIRVGGDGDGGYLIPDDLAGVEHCFSPGVGEEASFEKALMRRGVRSCFLADYSVDSPPVGLDSASFVKKFVSTANSDKTIEINRWIEESVKDRPAADSILQMDIEGDEYAVLPALSPVNLLRFRIIVVEWHKCGRWGDRLHLGLMHRLLDKLLEYFEIAHLHPNNARDFVDIRGVKIPTTFEMTLLRKDRVRAKIPARDYPHPLDRPNVSRRPDIRLPADWIRDARP